RILSALVITDANGFIHAGPKNLAISNFASLGRSDDRTLDSFNHVVSEDHLDLYLWNQVYGVLSSAIDFRVALLAPVSAHLEHGHPLHSDLVQRILDRFELRSLDDSFDFGHGR